MMEMASKAIAANSTRLMRSLKYRTENPTLNNSSICPTARTGATLCKANPANQKILLVAAQIPAKNKRVESLDVLEFHQVINTIDPSARKSDHHSVASVFCNLSWVMWEDTRL